MFRNLICFNVTVVTNGYLFVLARGMFPRSWRLAGGEGVARLEGKMLPGAVPEWPVADTSLAPPMACGSARPNNRV